VNPEVFQAGIPCPGLQHHQRDHPADHGVHQRRRQLPCGTAAIHVDSGGVKHGLQAISAESRCQWPPPADRHIAQYRDAVDPWALWIKFAQPPGGLMKWQHALNDHRCDERVVDQYRHCYLLL
jgi:hypothetical protein